MSWTHGVQPSESAIHFEYCDDVISLSIRVQTTLNHCRFVFYHNIDYFWVIHVWEPIKALRNRWQVDASSVVCTLNDNRKLAKQTAILLLGGKYVFLLNVSVALKKNIKDAAVSVNTAINKKDLLLLTSSKTNFSVRKEKFYPIWIISFYLPVFICSKLCPFLHFQNLKKLACIGTRWLFSFLYCTCSFSTSKASVLQTHNVLETVTTMQKHRAVNATLDGESEVSRESAVKVSTASLMRLVYMASVELMVWLASVV